MTSYGQFEPALTSWARSDNEGNICFRPPVQFYPFRHIPPDNYRHIGKCHLPFKKEGAPLLCKEGNEFRGESRGRKGRIHSRISNERLGLCLLGQFLEIECQFECFYRNEMEIKMYREPSPQI